MRMRRFLWMLALTMFVLSAWPPPAWATRMISGTISTPLGQPAVGFKVKAFDEDDGPDDPMGEAITDAQGRYSIGPYADQRWDTDVGTTSWRPDIYINVYQMIGGHWVVVKKSTTYPDHRQADDLTIDLQVTGIVGHVWDRAGIPVGGALVKAFDEDDLSADDFMNEVPAGPNGEFAMVYEHKGDWDTWLPGSVSWRPDIYIEVHDVVRGRRIKINNKSATTSDALQSSNVSINEEVPRRRDIDYVVPDPWDWGGVLHVLAYNIYMRPATFLRNGQAIRVPFIVREILRDHYDVIVFSEAFDDGLREQLRSALSSVYPYHAKVPESADPTKQDGGVKILSRWPIENGPNLMGEHRLFGAPCVGWDCHAEKGVVYVRIKKLGTRYHVLGTHVQADEPPISTSRTVRRAQFQKIKRFIDDKTIASNEPVIIAGDLNVDRYGSPAEYAEMLQTLNAAHPPLEGHPYSFDGPLNDLVNGDGRKLLDYVLYSRGHKQPMPFGASTRVMFYRSDSPWREFLTERFRWDISDHYPVFGRLRLALQVQPAVRSPGLPALQPTPRP